jgi:hypothetical protein
MIGSDETGGPRHIPEDEMGRSWNIPGKMTRHDAGVDIVTAARIEADDQVDLSSFIKVLHGLSYA